MASSLIFSCGRGGLRDEISRIRSHSFTVSRSDAEPEDSCWLEVPNRYNMVFHGFRKVY